MFILTKYHYPCWLGEVQGGKCCSGGEVHNFPQTQPEKYPAFCVNTAHCYGQSQEMDHGMDQFPEVVMETNSTYPSVLRINV